MALIKCSECGKEFSNRAKACPNCACKTEEIEEESYIDFYDKVKDEHHFYYIYK